MELKIKKVNPKATTPSYANEGDACMDLYSCEKQYIEPGITVAIDTGLQVEVPEGYVMKVYPRSGISLKTGLRLGNCTGIIDSGYRGNVKVILHNTNIPTNKYYDVEVETLDNKKESSTTLLQGTYVVNVGDKIAQFELTPVEKIEITETSEELSESKRGKKGFGASGIK